MRPDEREVAGLTCSAVMAALSDLIDGDLPDERRRQVEAHVRECRLCEQFGADLTVLLAGVRRQLATPEPVAAEVLQRLRGRLEHAG